MKKLSMFDWLVILAAVAGLAAYLAGSRNVYKEFSDQKTGVSFQYPPSYTVTEESFNNSFGDYLEETISIPGKNLPNNPPLMLVGVYDNSAKLSVEQWVNKHANDLSHYSSKQADPINITIAGADGLAFPWVSAVSAEQVVLSNNGKIIYLTLIYNDANDPVVGDFQHLLTTLKLN